MHAAPAFRMNDDEEMIAFISARRFATLVVAAETGPVAAHLPLLVERDGEKLILAGHLAANNPVVAHAKAGAQALVLFHGADAYVTPSLYLSKREHGKVVPTWNYIAVEAAGALTAVTDTAALRAHLEVMTDTMEASASAPWAVSDAPEDYLARQLAAIVGVRLAVRRLEGIRKISQNRPEADRAGVQAGFANSNDPNAQLLAREMTRDTVKDATHS